MGMGIALEVLPPTVTVIFHHIFHMHVRIYTIYQEACGALILAADCWLGVLHLKSCSYSIECGYREQKCHIYVEKCFIVLCVCMV